MTNQLKIARIMVLVLFTLLTISSCSKDDNDTPSFSNITATVETLNLNPVSANSAIPNTIIAGFRIDGIPKYVDITKDQANQNATMEFGSMDFIDSQAVFVHLIGNIPIGSVGYRNVRLPNWLKITMNGTGQTILLQFDASSSLFLGSQDLTEYPNDAGGRAKFKANFEAMAAKFLTMPIKVAIVP